MKLLIVEDDERIRKMIISVIADLASEIYECGDGKQALPAYTTHLPDWVLMDLIMPETDGIAATHQIKSSFPDAKIIIVTSCEGAAMREAAEKAGAHSYVVKENLLALREILTAHLSASGA